MTHEQINARLEARLAALDKRKADFVAVRERLQRKLLDERFKPEPIKRRLIQIARAMRRIDLSQELAMLDAEDAHDGVPPEPKPPGVVIEPPAARM